MSHGTLREAVERDSFSQVSGRFHTRIAAMKNALSPLTARTCSSFELYYFRNKSIHNKSDWYALFLLYTLFEKNTRCPTFCNNYINCLSIFEILRFLETTMNYLQKKYNTSRHFLKTLTKSLKKLQLLYQFVMPKLCETFTITL